MYKDLQRTCTAVLLIEPFVWRRSRCRCLCGLLTLFNASSDSRLPSDGILALRTEV